MRAEARTAVERVAVELAIHNEAGESVPYATVWSFHDPCTNVRERLSLCLNAADAQRLASRLRDSFEFVQSGLVPLPMLLVPRAGDVSGMFRDNVESESLAVKSSASGSIRVGYVILKRGYLPAAVEFEAKERHARFEATVVLKRDPTQSRSSAPYVAAFERLRYELSDIAANEQMSAANQARLQRIRGELEEVARQALAAADKPAAARAYGRLAWMPALTLIDGRIAGFEQAKFDQDMLNRAVDLDRANPFLQGAALRARARAIEKRLQPGKMNAQERAVYDDFLRENEEWVRRTDAAVWPRDRLLLWHDFANIGDWERAYQWIKAAQAAEPKYEDYERRSFKDLKAQMQLRGVPVPAHWR
jgi:hypothetical protein